MQPVVVAFTRRSVVFQETNASGLFMVMECRCVLAAAVEMVWSGKEGREIHLKERNDGLFPSVSVVLLSSRSIGGR